MYTTIADDLRRRIASGEFAPGQDVPTEAQLAERWSTSRGPIRNALALLRSEGLIDSARGRPSRVAARKSVQRVDVSVAFTSWAREIGAVPGARTQELRLRRADEDEAAVLDLGPEGRVVEVLRLRLLDGVEAMLEKLVYTEQVGRQLFDADLDAVSITEYLDERGFGFTEVDHEIESVAAEERDASLLGVPVGTPLLRLIRVSRDGAGRTFEYSEDRYRGDLIRFTVSASGRSTAGGGYVRRIATA